MSTKSATAYTEQFLIEQMKNDWGIDRQNQLLFMWSKIYGGISQKKLYNWLDDNNEARHDDYKKNLKNIADFYTNYKKGLKEYMDAGISDAERRSAEADQERVIMAYYGLFQFADFYTIRSNALESEIKLIKELSAGIIKECKEFNIDYHSLLPTEVQRFFDLDPVKQNTITCDKAKVNILNIVLQEIVKLYNLYQKAPQAKREILDIKNRIEECKINNIDYKKVLTPEMLKFFGTE